MSQGGFELRSWATNCSDLQGTFQEDGRAATHTSEYEKLLGYKYHTSNDTIELSEICTEPMEKVTKRTVLSCLAGIFDPLGIFLPVTVQGKIFMQEIWAEKYEWDDVLSPEMCKKWHKIHKDLCNLTCNQIDRYAFSSEVALYVFTDASASVYGFSVYARCKIGERVTSNLIFSKCPSSFI